MAKWLVKSDPDTYSWDNFAADRKTVWDGVRNYQARNNLAAMREGDLALFYHSNQDRAVVGTAEITKAAFQDFTTDDPRWLAVELSVGFKFDIPVTLSTMKKTEALQGIALIKQSRLSVMPIEEDEYDLIVALGSSHK